MQQPSIKPANPNFSSGPCAKRPGWSPSALAGALVGRSHRSGPGKAKLAVISTGLFGATGTLEIDNVRLEPVER